MTARDRSKRPRRQRATPEAPLLLAASLPSEIARPSRLRALARPLAALVAALPGYTLDRAGRARANLLRAAIGGASALLVMASRGDLTTGALAAAVAATLLLVPVPEHRKRRWLRAAQGLATPVLRPSTRAATLRFDGARLELRALDDGRVVRSLRPYAPPAAVALLDDGPDLVLGLVPPARGADPFVFRAERASLATPFDPLPPPPLALGPVAALRGRHGARVDGPALTALLEALWDPAEGGLPRRDADPSPTPRPRGPR